MQMGMTVWIHTLQGRTLSKYDNDHSLLNFHSENLDKVCESINVPKLTSFFDMTDLTLNLSEGTEEEESEMDPETGWPYGIDDMDWFDAAIGQSTLLTLRAHIPSHPILALKPETERALIEEIDDCLQKLSAPAKNGGKFHLALIL